MASAVSELIAGRWLLIATIILASAIAFVLPTLKRQLSLRQLPIAGQANWDQETRRIAYLSKAQSIYEEAYQKVCPLPAASARNAI